MDSPAGTESDSSSTSLHTIPDLNDVDINGFQDPSTITPLMQAANSGDIEAVKSALKRQYHVNNANNQGFTALHIAVVGKHLEVVKLLLQEENVNVDVKDWNGMTPLMHACRNRVPLNIIKCLLEHDCDIHLQDNLEMTAVWHAIFDSSLQFNKRATYSTNASSFAEFDADILGILMKFGADIHAFAFYDSPFTFVLRNYEKSSTISAEMPCALMYYGADPTITDDHSIIDDLDDVDGALYDLVLPYFSICDLRIIQCCKLHTIAKLWQIQSHYDKLRFAEIVQQSDDVNLIQLLFNATDVTSTADLAKLSSFLYQLFESEEMYEVMYSNAIGKDIQTDILCAIALENEVPDKFAADMLRLSLCNYNRLIGKAYSMLLLSIRRPRQTIKVLEDFNVCVKSRHDLRLHPNNTWRMYLRPPSNIISNWKVFQKHTDIPRFYKDRSTNPPSLVELSRNIIRRRSKPTKHLYREKPFDYAARIKALPCPKLVHDLILLRKPIYS